MAKEHNYSAKTHPTEGWDFYWPISKNFYWWRKIFTVYLILIQKFNQKNVIVLAGHSFFFFFQCNSLIYCPNLVLPVILFWQLCWLQHKKIGHDFPWLAAGKAAQSLSLKSVSKETWNHLINHIHYFYHLHLPNNYF